MQGLQHRHLGCDLFVQLDLTFYVAALLPGRVAGSDASGHVRLLRIEPLRSLAVTDCSVGGSQKARDDGTVTGASRSERRARHYVVHKSQTWSRQLRMAPLSVSPRHQRLGRGRAI